MKTKLTSLKHLLDTIPAVEQTEFHGKMRGLLYSISLEESIVSSALAFFKDKNDSLPESIKNLIDQLISERDKMS